MVTLNLLTDEEVKHIFSKIHSLLPIHEDLIKKMEKIRDDKGRIYQLGHTLVNWVSCCCC